MEKHLHRRRAFLQKLIYSGIVIAGGGSLLLGCNSKDSSTTDEGNQYGGDCGDYSKLTPEDHAARKQLGYEEKSPVKDAECQLCNLYLPPKEGNTCGGCTLFKGPIEPEGTCTYWAPKQG